MAEQNAHDSDIQSQVKVAMSSRRGQSRKMPGNPPMVKGKEMGSKRVARKKNIRKPPKGQSSRTEALLNPNPVTMVQVQFEDASQTDQPSGQARQPVTEQVQELVVGSVLEPTSSTDQVIDLDLTPSPQGTRERPVEALTEEFQSILSRWGIKVTKSVRADNLFLDEEKETEPERPSSTSTRQGSLVQPAAQPTPVKQIGTFGRVSSPHSQPQRPSMAEQSSGAGPSQPSYSGPIPRPLQSSLPSEPFFPEEFQWVETTFRNMLKVGFNHDCIWRIDEADPNNLLTLGLTKMFEAFYAINRNMQVHFQSFGGGFNHQVAHLDQLRSRIRELEGQLKEAQTITMGEKAAWEAKLARAESDKEAAIRTNEITRSDLAKSTEDVASLTKEKETLSQSCFDLSDANKTLGEELTRTKKALEERDNEVAQLFRVIRVIESDKVANFESGLVLARWHIDNYPEWENIDWTQFKVPKHVEIPVPDFFLQPGRIKDIVQKTLSGGPKK